MMIHTLSDAIKVLFLIMLGYFGGRIDSANDDNAYIAVMIIFFAAFLLVKFVWKVI